MKKISIPFLFFNIFITFVFILLLFSVCDSVHAASEDLDPLPYYVDYYQPEYFDFTYSSWDSFINNYISSNHQDYDLVWFSEPSEWNSTYDTIDMFFVKTSGGTLTLRNSDLNSDVSYPNFNFGTDYVVYSGYVYEERIIYLKNDPTNISINFSVGGFNATYSLLGSRSINSLGYTPNYPYYLKSGSSFLIDNNKVFVNGTPTRPHHDPKPPRDSQDNPEYSSGDSAPTVVPDSSGSSSDSSLLAKTIQYYGNLINQNVNSNFNNLYDNLSPIINTFSQLYNMGLDSNGDFNLLTGLSNLFSYLFIPDPDDLTSVLMSHDIYDVVGLVETTQGYVNDVKNMITGGENLYKITLPEFYIMGVALGPYDIDFSWYIPLKIIGDPIIAAFLIFGWVMWLHTRLPYWLRGQQGDITLMTKEVQK